jgi:hypothetical protein
MGIEKGISNVEQGMSNDEVPMTNAPMTYSNDFIEAMSRQLFTFRNRVSLRP